MDNEPVKHNIGDDRQEGFKALSSSLRISFVWLYILVIIMFAVTVAQSFLIVKQHEAALIYRFGNLRAIAGTGLHFILPYPFEEAQIVETARSKQIETNSFTPALLTKKDEEIPKSLKPGADGYLITGDLNIIHAKCVLTFLVEQKNQDAILRFFVFGAETDKYLKSMLDNAMVKAASEMETDEILANPDKFRNRIASKLRENIKDSLLEIVFENKDIAVTASPPAQAKSVFDALNQANQNQDQVRNEALSYKIKTEKDAEIQRDIVINNANSEKIRKIANAMADADTFTKRLEQFKKNPELVSRIIYEETLFRILENTDEKFIVDKNDNRQLRVLLGRNLEKSKSPKKKD